MTKQNIFVGNEEWAWNAVEGRMYGQEQGVLSEIILGFNCTLHKGSNCIGCIALDSVRQKELVDGASNRTIPPDHEIVQVPE